MLLLSHWHGRHLQLKKLGKQITWETCFAEADNICELHRDQSRASISFRIQFESGCNTKTTVEGSLADEGCKRLTNPYYEIGYYAKAGVGNRENARSVELNGLNWGAHPSKSLKVIMPQ